MNFAKLPELLRRAIKSVSDHTTIFATDYAADTDGLEPHITIICGRVIQSSAPLRYAIVEGLDVRDTCVHNYRRQEGPFAAGSAAGE